MSAKRRAGRVAGPTPEVSARGDEPVTQSPSPLARLSTKVRTLKGAVVAIAGVGAILGGLAGYWNAYQAARGTAQSSLLTLASTGNAGPLSIVVLPFANLTGDPQQAYLADGLTSAVTADLSRIRDAFVVSATTAYALKDKPATVQQIGKELGVRFALQGGVQRNGDKIRINAQLADTASNSQLWSESFDGNQADLFALQDLVTARIGNSIGREMVILTARDSETRKSDPKVADLMLRARAMGLKLQSATRYGEEQALYRQVLRLEPNNAKAMVGLAISLSTEAWNDKVPDPVVKERQLVEARDLALRARELDPNDPRIYVTLCDYAVEHGDYASGIRLAQTALSLDPKNPARYNDIAGAYFAAGEPKRAIEYLAQGIRLDPKDVDQRLFQSMGGAHFMRGDDETATQWFLKAVDANPDVVSSHVFLAMLHARKGDLTRSRVEVAAVLRLNPNTRLSNVEARTIEGFTPAYREYWEKTLVPAWRLAGLPE